MKVLRYLRRRFPESYSLVMIIFRQGPLGYLDYFRNSRLSWSASELVAVPKELNASSISDGTDYVALCRLAVQDESIFEKFKSCQEYRGILEHCDFSQGKEYLRMLKGNMEMLLHLKNIARVDNGKPFTFHYKSIGLISPTQIRYAKVLQDLEILFGSLNKLSIAEIGVGYGGQAIQLLSRWSPTKYIVYDLEWPAKLMLKNLDRSSVELKIQPEIGSWQEYSSCDLIISNYAFSELFRDTQEVYFENVVKGSKAGYVIYNHLHPHPKNSMSAEEFASRIPGAIILKENPLTFPGNVLVVWGHLTDVDLQLFL
jgi:hypothetical protein